MEHTSKKLLQVVLDACEDKLAQEVVALDVASLTPVAEYFATKPQIWPEEFLVSPQT